MVCRVFLDLIERLRLEAWTKSVPGIIAHVLQETGYLASLVPKPKVTQNDPYWIILFVLLSSIQN